MGKHPAWLSAHVYYHGDLDRLLVDAVGPALRGLAATCVDVPRHFFLRHWEGGPHLRLRVAAEHDEDMLRAQLSRELERYLSRHPSDARMHDEDYQEFRRLAMRLEPEHKPLPGLLPSNSVRYLDYQPEYGRYGRGESIAAVEAHFCESSDIARHAIESAMTVTERQLMVFYGLIAGWALASYRQEALLDRLRGGDLRFDPGIQVPADALVRHYDQRGDELRTLTARALSDARANASEPARNLRQRWCRSIAVLLSRMDRARRTQDGMQATQPTPGALAVVDHCGHLLGNRLGLSLEAEARLRLLACQALLDVMT